MELNEVCATASPPLVSVPPTAADKISAILALIASGKTLYVCTYLRVWHIRQRDIDKFAAVGKPLLKAKDNSMYMARGRGYVCIDYCGLRIVD